MSDKKKKEQEEFEVTGECITIPEPEPPKEMTTIEKVQLMSSLAGVATDNDIANMLKSRPNGEVVYEVFISAVEKKLKEIMDGKPEELPQHLTSVLTASARMDQILRQFQEMMVGFMGTPLVEVLTLMNSNLGGKKFNFDWNKVMGAVPAPLPQHTQQQMAQQAPQEYYDDPSPGRRGSGNYWPS